MNSQSINPTAPWLAMARVYDCGHGCGRGCGESYLLQAAFVWLFFHLILLVLVA
jgi:hypothetical protein